MKQHRAQVPGSVLGERAAVHWQKVTVTGAKPGFSGRKESNRPFQTGLGLLRLFVRSSQ